MVVLDTNVISEMMQVTPEIKVKSWLAHQHSDDLYLTAVTEAELRYGLVIMPQGRRRRELAEILEKILDDFKVHILPFNSPAALAYSEIAAQRRVVGLSVQNFDCQIAAIARSVGADIATRNVKDFEGCGVGIIDPWQHQT